MHSTRTGQIIGQAIGTRYSFAGIGKPEDEWSIPIDKFRIENIVGQYLIQLEEGNEGLVLKKERDEVVLSQAPVVALIAPDCTVRSVGCLAEVTDKKGFVHVLFGHTRLPEQVDEILPADVSDVKTPSTPRPVAESD